MAEGDEEEEELNKPEVPRSGSITDEEFVVAELKQPPESVPTVAADEVGRDDIDEPL